MQIGRDLAAAIVLPLQERRRQRVVGDPPAVGRIGRARRVRDRQRRLDAAATGTVKSCV